MKFSKIHILTFLVFCAVSISTQAQGYNNEVIAKIALEDKFNTVTITGTALNHSEINQSLRYVLTVFKGGKDSANKSKNSQAGFFTLNPGQQKNLSVTSINSNNKERIIILLLIYNLEDDLIGKDRIVLNDGGAGDSKIILERNDDTISNSQDTQFRKADGVVLRGIVIEDTKTKLGSDFYKMFYIDYLNNEINGREIVLIKEVLAIGNNTKIEIHVGSDILIEFIIRPQISFLTEMKDHSIARVQRYFLNLEKNGAQVRRY